MITLNLEQGYFEKEFLSWKLSKKNWNHYWHKTSIPSWKFFWKELKRQNVFKQRFWPIFVVKGTGQNILYLDWKPQCIEWVLQISELDSQSGLGMKYYWLAVTLLWKKALKNYGECFLLPVKYTFGSWDVQIFVILLLLVQAQKPFCPKASKMASSWISKRTKPLNLLGNLKKELVLRLTLK